MFLTERGGDTKRIVTSYAPNGIQGEKAKRDDEEDEHGVGEPSNLVVVRRRQVADVVAKCVIHGSPEVDRADVRVEAARRGALGVAVLVHQVSDDARSGKPFREADGKGHDGKYREGEGHHSHHDPADSEVDAAAAALETCHIAGYELGTGVQSFRVSRLRVRCP